MDKKVMDKTIDKVIDKVMFKIMRLDQNMKGTSESYKPCTILDGLAWFATSLAPMTLLYSKKEADGVIKKSKIKWPEAVFKIEEHIEIEETKVINKDIDDIWKDDTISRTRKGKDEPF